ncbi:MULTISPECIES: flagellar export protein FliJ [Bacillus]|mgnify:FL=1|jgi:flagellar FliJ protein|uniref:flagellar export protein FliJ n=1 Tax=Bacillus TaxID=1386 RepID=UPI00065E3841|nr:flagellar export protein FliJ [Bacillus smithii]AKP46866.1 Flagellar protein FliJ [Bacillus smithii]MED4882872.1 flagellar export protein FliJ [Bacillus smithii]MED4926903.1 flagellar export protein FliJ [Bacillus smithii]
MGYYFKFEKILQIKEREKEEIQSGYHRAKRQFEQVAEKLYELLKKKEDLLAFQETQLASGFPVYEIQHYQLFISNLEKMIDYQQQLVMNARNRMFWFENKLKEKNIEVKKYEKIKEKEWQKYQKLLGQMENREMDELSVIQFMNRRNR